VLFVFVWLLVGCGLCCIWWRLLVVARLHAALEPLVVYGFLVFHLGGCSCISCMFVVVGTVFFRIVSFDVVHLWGVDALASPFCL